MDEIVVMSGMDAITSINQSRVKVDIGIQLATHKVLVLKGSPLQGNGNLDQWLPPTNLKDLIGDALDDASPRIIVAIDAMTESHQSTLLALHLVNEHWNTIDTPNLLQHPQHCLIRPSMQWSIQC